MSSECKCQSRACGVKDPRASNPLKHGAFAKTPLLPGEDPEERKALDRSYREAFKPASQPEEDIVREMAELVWRRTRLSRAEMAMKNAAVANAGRHLPEAPHASLEPRYPIRHRDSLPNSYQRSTAHPPGRTPGDSTPAPCPEPPGEAQTRAPSR